MNVKRMRQAVKKAVLRELADTSRYWFDNTSSDDVENEAREREAHRLFAIAIRAVRSAASKP